MRRGSLIVSAMLTHTSKVFPQTRRSRVRVIVAMPYFETCTVLYYTCSRGLDFYLIIFKSVHCAYV